MTSRCSWPSASLLTMLYSPCLPTQSCRRLRARSGEEALSVGQNGEERHAQHGTGWQRANGGCGKTKRILLELRI
jgi:hypothetical protein